MARLPQLVGLTPAETANYNHMMWVSTLSIDAVIGVDAVLTFIAIGFFVAGLIGRSSNPWDNSSEAL